MLRSERVRGPRVPGSPWNPEVLGVPEVPGVPEIPGVPGPDPTFLPCLRRLPLKMFVKPVTEAVVCRCSVKSGLKNFAKFTGRQLCQSLWGMRPATLLKNVLKKVFAQVFSCGFCDIFKYSFSYRTPLVVASAVTMMKLRNIKNCY